MNNSKPVEDPEKPGEKISPRDPGEAHRDREAQLNAIIAATPVPKFVIDKNHRVISWNRALENMTGIKAAEVLGTNLHWKAFYSEERPCLADLIVDGTVANIPLLYPHSYQRMDLVSGAYEVTDFFPFAGSRGKWLHFIAAPLLDDAGAVIGAVDTLEDITTFIGIQQELRESEERYSSLFSNSASVSLLIDPDTGRIVDANDAAVRYYGYPRDQLLAMGIFDLNRLPRDTVVRNLVRAKEEKAKHFQSVHYRSGGVKRYVEIYSGPIRVQGKALFYSIIHDITDRKKAETELQKSQYHLSEAMDMAHMADWEFDVTTATFTFNDRFFALYATTAEREGGYLMPADVYMREFTHPDDQQIVADEIAKALSRPEPGYFSLREHRIIRRDGKVRYIIVRIRVTMGDDGQITGTHGANQDITERKMAENALRESEERYSALFSNNYSVSLLIDPDTGRIVDANDAAVRYYGYTRDQLLAMGIFDLNRLPRDTVVRNLVRAKEEKAKHFQSVHYRADGEKRYVEIFSGPIRVHGKALFYSIIHDITDRKLAEERLRESENKFSTVFQNSPVALTLVSAGDGKIVDVNDAFVRNSGYAPEEVLGKTSDELGLFPDDNDRRRMRSALQNRQCFYGMELNTRTKSGNIRACLFSSCLIQMSEKSFILSTIEDITERKMAENALRESEERYRTLIDQLPDYVIVHREGILLYVNPAGAAIMSYDVKTLIGKSFFSMIAPESHEVTRQAVLRRMRGEEVPPYEIRIAARDGSLHTVLVHGALIQYDGAPASINVLTDITPIKEAEETIRHANEDLEQRVLERTEALRQANVQLTAEIAARAQAEQVISRSLEEKVLLLREIHHRVKNNLQIITSLLKLQSRYISDPNVLESIKDTQSRVRAMSLVHERIYRSPDIAEINLKDYLMFLVKQVAQFYDTRQHQITISVNMPVIMADIDTVTPLGLIMNELVSNSLKHAFPSGQTGSISITGEPQGTDAFRFVYHDSGVGMPEGLDWTRSESLGLQLVNSLVAQLDGTIELQNGEGTTFIIDIRRKYAGNGAEENRSGRKDFGNKLPDEPDNTGA